ncbi:L-shaped tail fiber protein [Klebsiella phage CPRSB]|nr:L-shaped tail fiber protein [Klebsiella phage CPRSB]
MTVSGNVDITGNQLKTTSLWVTGDAAVNGVLTVDGRARFNQEFIVSTSVNVQNTGNSHLVFRKADGTEKGILWADDPGNVSIRAGGGSGPVWNFW